TSRTRLDLHPGESHTVESAGQSRPDRGDHMDLLTIGAFARLTRLSPKALRLYDSVNLLAPAHVDQASGYRWYTPVQAERARLVALLRQLDMPLARIAELIGLPSDEQAAALAKYWSEREDRMRA